VGRGVEPTFAFSLQPDHRLSLERPNDRRHRRNIGLARDPNHDSADFKPISP
jgi:hypothetical protein